MGSAEIGKLIGRPPGGVKSKAERVGIALRQLGEMHHSAKYSDALVEQARDFADIGFTRRQIARKINVPEYAVDGWINYKCRTGISLKS